jgi:hypothetical protein
LASRVTSNEARVCTSAAFNDGLIWVQVAPASDERQMPRA